LHEEEFTPKRGDFCVKHAKPVQARRSTNCLQAIFRTISKKLKKLRKSPGKTEKNLLLAA
jgi:hypothetical protein